MPAVHPNSSFLFPDNPRKWDGWSKYRSDNLYERLCLDPRSNPNDEQIQLHCSGLLQWWKHKLPLKNQPSNPLAQLLGRGIDEASRYLIEARIQLLDPERRRALDEELAASIRQEALEEFQKFVSFSIKDRILTPAAEANLVEFGQHNGFSDDQIQACIQDELQRCSGRRAAASPTALADRSPHDLRHPWVDRRAFRAGADNGAGRGPTSQRRNAATSDTARSAAADTARSAGRFERSGCSYGSPGAEFRKQSGRDDGADSTRRVCHGE